ncbi:MAG: hypothetical protein K2J12_00175, partial [Muribaculaceae bacterium]|nr:hypothetical protein [Muribaculaceae bacterium]
NLEIFWIIPKYLILRELNNISSATPSFGRGISRGGRRGRGEGFFGRRVGLMGLIGLMGR